ncbi:MAG: DUF1549 domain-containing protein, partial [Planctomycetes bacterium]|nr:DUF1549 domain-containing protein [Planctomycetota bacterium]
MRVMMKSDPIQIDNHLVHRTNAFLFCCVIFATLMSTCTIGFSSEPMKFNRDVKPILSDRCFLCHGPDKLKRINEMRLDDRQSAIDQQAIVPGDPDASKILSRITSTDPDLQMPPPSSKLGRLTAAEVATIKKWISEGAEYEPHWSFISLKPATVPQNGLSNPIDALVTASLSKRGLKQQSEADRTTLIRRLSFDLTGLPPTPEDVTSFLSNQSPNAYEQLVDGLLKSERYGER